MKTLQTLQQVCSAMSPNFWVAVLQDLRQQLVQLLLHGEDALLQLPIGVVPIGTEVAHDHLHLRQVYHLADVISQFSLSEA